VIGHEKGKRDIIRRKNPMKQLWTILIIAVLITATMPVLAQKIETATSDHNQILHLKTALNHLTVIELREPVTPMAV